LFSLYCRSEKKIGLKDIPQLLAEVSREKLRNGIVGMGPDGGRDRNVKKCDVFAVSEKLEGISNLLAEIWVKDCTFTPHASRDEYHQVFKHVVHP
jgi:hypothetical protein